MSLILDALRGGRPRATPRPSKANTAQTDAVLHTLGYGHFRTVSVINRIKWGLLYLVAAMLLAAVGWGAALWVKSQYFTNAAPVASARPSRPVTPVPQSVSVPPAPPQERGRVPFSTDAQEKSTRPLSSAQAKAEVKPSAASAPTSTAPPSRGNVPASRPPTVVAGTPPSLAALAISSGASTGTLVSQADHFQLALYYQRSGDFENALLQYRAVLQRDELNAEAHNNLGLLYRGKGLYDEAVKEFVRAIAINQRYVKAHNNLGVTYLSQRKDDAGASEFRTALAIDPRNVESLVNLSLAEKNNGNGDEARALLVRALDIDPRSAEAHYNFALLADEAGDKPSAMTHYRAFLQYANDHPDLVPQVRARVDALSR